MNLKSIIPYLILVFVFLTISCSSDSGNEVTVDPKAANNKSLGTAARDFLSAESFT